MRLTGLNYVLQNFDRAGAPARVWPESLILGAWVVHAVNSLHRRPNDRQTSLHLLDVVTYHVTVNGGDDSSDDEYDDEPPTAPVGYGQGLFFVADIVLDDHVWRLHRTSRMQTFVPEDLPRIYNCATLYELERRLGVAAGREQRKVHPQRVANRRPQTQAVELVRPDVAAEEIIPVFALRDAGVEVVPRLVITGDDVNIETHDNDNCHPDTLIQGIWRQMPMDLISTSPNRKSSTAPAHTLLSPEQRDAVTWQLFLTLDLTRVFPHAYVYRLNGAAWKVLFDVYFPPKDSKLLHASAQNWPSMTYLARWQDLMSRVTLADSNRIRREVKVLFDKIKWLPNAKADRVWQTKTVKTKNVKFYPQGQPPAAAPHIAVNETLVMGEAIMLGNFVPAAGNDDGEEDPSD